MWSRGAVTSERVPSLLLDIQAIQGGFFGNRGIRRYVLGFTRALLGTDVVRALLVNPSRPWVEEFPSDIRTAPNLMWSTRSTLRELTGEDVTAYVMTSPFEQASPTESVLPSLVVESGIPIVALLYDLIPEIVDVYPAELMPAYRARRHLLKDADLVLTLSDHVRRDAVRRLGMPVQRTAVIGAAVSEFFRPRDPGERPRDLLAGQVPRVTRPFALSVTGWQAHKNVEALIEAWSRLPGPVRRRYQLVLTCPLPPGGDTAWSDVAAGFGLAPDDIIVTGRVDDSVVRALYQEAELFVLPSFEEGFGLPVLEAARCGCPAITSGSSSLPEVLDWEPATFPPENVDRMAETVERGLLDPLFRADLRAVGDAAATRHTWDRVAKRTIAASSRVDTARTSHRRPTPRVALVCRFTPATSPTAAAADRVGAELPPAWRVDRFDTAELHQAASAPSASPAPRSGAFPVRTLGRVYDPWGYDAIVYLVDAHPTHELLDLARARPGVVWFVEQPAVPLVNELSRDATAVVRSPELSALAADAGPFGRSAPSAAADDGSEVMDVLRAALAMHAAPVMRSAG